MRPISSIQAHFVSVCVFILKNNKHYISTEYMFFFFGFCVCIIENSFIKNKTFYNYYEFIKVKNKIWFNLFEFI